eukprot:Phypoly_transcript_09198.p1 GENE.Phypoly_transcript_09198~~Phypoly_transcript_09198.p1  ORF type:complete len:463 (+),score=57.54 Phypoly_transcript_09198:111-1391(+)
MNYLELMETLGINVQNTTNLTVTNIGYFKNLQYLDSILTPNSIEKYIFWRVYQWMASVNVSSCWGVPVPSPFCQDIMKISPTPPPNPPWEQSYVCRSYVHNVLTDYVGLIFTYQNMNGYVSESIRNMTNQIHQAFNNSLPSLSWLDATSLANVRFKLGEIIQIIGHSEVMDRYENVTTTPVTYYNNLWEITAATVKFKNTFASSPFNRSDFDFDPMLVNAFYNPPTNSINFPAGFLESPLYSASWPKLFQYGILGFVVGHETTHGFDNYGSYWNAFGLPGDILDQNTRDNFNKNAQCIADYYSDFVVFGNTTMNGTSTLGENIADIGGLKNSYRAYQDYVAQNGPEFADYTLLQNLTTNQVFFVWWSQLFCSVENDAFIELQIKIDPHSPFKFRVLGPAAQFDEFAAVFNCSADAPLNPPERCNLW